MAARTAGSPRALLHRVQQGVCAMRELGGLGLLLSGLILLPIVGLAVLATTTGTWLPWFAAHDLAAAALFAALATTLCALSLVPSYAVAVAAGYLFGAADGALVALLAITGAAWLGRTLMTPIAGDRLIRFVIARERVHRAYVALLGSSRGTSTAVVSLVRLAPVTPFAGTNLLMAAARVEVGPFLLGTLIGLGPRTALAAVAGAGLAELQFGTDPGGATAFAVTLAALTIAVVGLAVLARRRLRTVQTTSSAQARR